MGNKDDFTFAFNPIMHNLPKWSDTAFAARFLKCV